MKRYYLLAAAVMFLSGCSFFGSKPVPSGFMIKGAVENEGLFGAREFRYQLKADSPLSITCTLFRIENGQKTVMKTQSMDITQIAEGELLVGARREDDKDSFDFSVNLGKNALLTDRVIYIEAQDVTIKDLSVPTLSYTSYSDFRALPLKREAIVFSYIYSTRENIDSVTIPEYARNLKEEDYKENIGVFLTVNVTQ